MRWLVKAFRRDASPEVSSWAGRQPRLRTFRADTFERLHVQDQFSAAKYHAAAVNPRSSGFLVRFVHEVLGFRE